MPQALLRTPNASRWFLSRSSGALRTVATVMTSIILAAGVNSPAGAEVLRVLKLTHHEATHSYRDTAAEFRLLTDFARRSGRAIEWIDAPQPEDLHALLVAGEGDVLVADLPDELARDERLDQRLAVGSHRHFVVARDTVNAHSPAGLGGQRVAVRLSSPLWPYFNRLAETLPDMSLVVMPAETTRDTLLAGVGNGLWDAAVVAARPGEDPAAATPRLTTLFAVTGSEPSAWYVRQDRQRLHHDLESYLRRFHAAYLAPPDDAAVDLDDIRQRGVLRVITRVDPQNYFLRKGKPAGFEYELVERFARAQGLELEFLIGESDQEILNWLRRGAGDLVTTRVNARELRADPTLARSLTYYHSASVVISRRGTEITGVDELAGRRVAVHANTVHHRALGALVATGTAVVPILVSADTPLDTVLTRLENWEIDAAIVDAHALGRIRAKHPLIVAGATLPVRFDYAWTTRDRDTELQRAVDEFLREQFRRETYNVLARRYFGRSRYAQFARLDSLSPYDDLVQRHAEAYDFDWRLIVAQIYHESRFDPAAVSPAGASGLMQLLPRTAAAMGVTDPFDPEAGIRGGIRYLDRLRERFDTAIAPRERTWFALAAYNVGLHRVQLARQRARAAGLDGNRWFGHVEQAMRSMTHDGSPCRCGQTVAYVRAIRSLYNTYHRLQAVLTAALPGSTNRPTG